MAYERIVPGTIEWELYSGNHFCRYHFAKKILQDQQYKNVLDAATGVGYGAKILADTFNEVVAVDRDEGALQVAKNHFNSDRITFVKGDCEKLDLIDRKFDAIVSFETLEHLKEPASFLQKCFQLLNEDGTIIISTPNQLVSGYETKKDWEYHEKEYTPHELIETVIQSGFQEVELYGQYYSSIGLMRNLFRSELNRIHSNPFMRMGKWIQKTFRRVSERALLPELVSDFEIRKYLESTEINNPEKEKPFVLIAIAKKKYEGTSHP